MIHIAMICIVLEDLTMRRAKCSNRVRHCYTGMLVSLRRQVLLSVTLSMTPAAVWLWMPSARGGIIACLLMIGIVLQVGGICVALWCNSGTLLVGVRNKLHAQPVTCGIYV